MTDTNMLAEAPAQEDITPGQAISEMQEIRQEKKRLADKTKFLNERWRELEGMLLRLSTELGSDKFSNDDGTATVTVDIVPGTPDWDTFFEWVKETDSFHMLQRRVATKAFREMHNAGEEVPGVEPYEKRSISLSKGKS